MITRFWKYLAALSLAAAILGMGFIPGCSLSSGGGGAGTDTGSQADKTAQAGGEAGSGAGTNEGGDHGEYLRRQVDFYMGITEPRSGALAEMVRESDRLQDDHINTVGLLPPVLITSRAGGWPRVIMEGSAASVESSIDEFHDAGLAVFLAPTTYSPGYQEKIEPSEMALEHLSSDVLEWAGKAEEQQVELLAPLSRYNLVLGTSAADQWSASVLPKIREVYTGELAAKVIPDLDGPPPAGDNHDFEQLDYHGYDYLMLDIFPTGEQFDQEAYRDYAGGLLDRAVMVARRDGLKGVLVGEFGGWRSQMGIDDATGPILGNEGQAVAAAVVLDELRREDVFGAFFRGWTTPGQGARNFPAEKTLTEYYGSSVAIPPGRRAD